MPKLKKSRHQEFLDVLAENVRICCKIRGAEKIAHIMDVSVATVYHRISKPEKITVDELYMLSEYIGISPADLIKPLHFSTGETNES